MSYQQAQNTKPPMRPTQPKPPTPMEVDQSVQSRHVNYMNRPSNSNFGIKRENEAEDQEQKRQRFFNIEVCPNETN
jgi:hypothetical protein